MTSTPPRNRRPRTTPVFHPDDYVGSRQYDRDREEILANFQKLQDGVDQIKTALYGVVPRGEHERIWQQNEARFSKLETKLDVSFDEVGRSYTPLRLFEDQIKLSREQLAQLGRNHDELRREFDALNNRTAGRFISNSTNTTQNLVYIICAVVGVAGVVLGHFLH